MTGSESSFDEANIGKLAPSLPPEPLNRIGNALYEGLKGGSRLASLLFRLTAATYSTARHLVLHDRPPFYCHERIVEIPWALKRVRELPPQAHILEIGDVLGPTFAKLGYNVATVDLAVPRVRRIPGWTYIRMDAREFRVDSFYDAAFSISTVEHIGIGHYGDPVDSAGDWKTIDAVRRALRPEGRLFLTVPYGPLAKRTWLRTYDAESLRDLLRDWSVNDMQILVFDRWHWRSAASSGDLERAAARLANIHAPAVVLLSATKKP